MSNRAFTSVIILLICAIILIISGVFGIIFDIG